MSNTLRPIIATFFMKQVRQNSWQFLAVYDNLAILVTIFVFIMFYSVAGYIFFSFGGEGVLILPTIGESYFNMLVLLTTANFPDVMLPAYNVNYFNSFFFITYLGIGLYFLFNILLANVYNHFLARF